MLLVTLALLPLSLAPVEWKCKSATYAKHQLKPIVGRFPSWLESNCIYAVAEVDNYPIAILPFKQISCDGQPIALNLYVNDKAVAKCGGNNALWARFRTEFGTLPLIPRKFK